MLSESGRSGPGLTGRVLWSAAVLGGAAGPPVPISRSTSPPLSLKRIPAAGEACGCPLQLSFHHRGALWS